MLKDLRFKAFSYLKFIYYSTNHHGVHSPFIFNLVTKCFYNQNIDYNVILKTYREDLLRNHHSIQVKDFGAGSKVFKNSNRQISKIAKVAGVSVANAKLLYRLVFYLKPQSMLEIGSSLGLATVAMSLGNPQSKITCIEGCPETASQFTFHLRKYNLSNVRLVVSDFDSYLHSAQVQNSKFDLIYFDGNHSYDATLSHFNSLLHTVTNNSVWIFDDIHWSMDMQNAWNKIKMHPKVKVTVDTFQWGIVFFRAEQAKQDFVIRV